MEGNQGAGSSRCYLLDVPPVSRPSVAAHQMEFEYPKESLQGLGFVVPPHGGPFLLSTDAIPFTNPTATCCEKSVSNPWSNEEVEGLFFGEGEGEGEKEDEGTKVLLPNKKRCGCPRRWVQVEEIWAKSGEEQPPSQKLLPLHPQQLQSEEKS
ncbi:hypothetical protein C4D60_Mb07t21880 [Musa balbisiana]|uniref:Uncharacterized protein n=1 Tax=Musa balbisiana TaxID=52838 RepID=A0A4S8JJ15_MUSBA|nr:hypothetical protein C4D60_Mb07t21880 [Musa balbisiana]